MRKATYKVKIPIPETENFKEIIFNSRKEICDFLLISSNTLNSMMNHTLKFEKSPVKHLSKIIIEKIENKEIKEVKKQINETEYHQQLISKLNNSQNANDLENKNQK